MVGKGFELVGAVDCLFPLVALYADDDHWLTIASSVKRSVYL